MVPMTRTFFFKSIEHFRSGGRKKRTDEAPYREINSWFHIQQIKKTTRKRGGLKIKTDIILPHAESINFIVLAVDA